MSLRSRISAQVSLCENGFISLEDATETIYREFMEFSLAMKKKQIQSLKEYKEKCEEKNLDSRILSLDQVLEIIQTHKITNFRVENPKQKTLNEVCA